MIDRKDKAMLAMQLGAPEGALTLPGHPIAYFIDDSTLYVHVWLPTGKFVCHTRVVAPFMPGDDYSITFMIGTVALWYHFPTYSLLPYGKPVDDFTPEQIEIRKAASQCFIAKHVTLPRKLHVADRSETMRRYYARQQANALLRHIPPGYVWVPEAERTAYRVLDGGSIMLVKPATNARHMAPGEDGALSYKTVKPSRRTGLITIEKKQYRFDKTKNILELVAQA